MKKLLIFALVSCMATAESTFVSATKNVAGKVAESVEKPFVAVKNTIVENEIDQDTKEVLGQFKDFPVQVAQDVVSVAQDVAHSKAAQTVKDTSNTAIAQTKKAATVVKDAAIRAKDAVVNAGTTVKNSIKNGATTIKTKTQELAQTEAAQDAKEVGTQFANAPVEAAQNIVAVSKAFWSKVITFTKSIKNELAN